MRNKLLEVQRRVFLTKAGGSSRARMLTGLPGATELLPTVEMGSNGGRFGETTLPGVAELERAGGAMPDAFLGDLL